MSPGGTGVATVLIWNSRTNAGSTGSRNAATTAMTSRTAGFTAHVAMAPISTSARVRDG